MKCYIKSNPGTRGYRKRMTAIWREIGEFEVSEQRLADQARAIKLNGWLSDIEIEELKREVDSRGVVCDEGSGSTHLTSELVTETDKERERLPALRKVNRKRLKAEVNKVNQVLKKMAPEGITNTDDLIYAGAVVVTEELGVRNKIGTKPKEPLWKRRLTTQVKEMRRDLSRVTALLQGRMLKEHHKRELEQKYKIAEIGLEHVSSNGERLRSVSIRRGIFQGDSLSPLLFVVSMIPLSLVLRKCEAGYTYAKNTKVNHLLFMDDLKLYARSECQLDSLI